MLENRMLKNCDFIVDRIKDSVNYVYLLFGKKEWKVSKLALLLFFFQLLIFIIVFEEIDNVLALRDCFLIVIIYLAISLLLFFAFVVQIHEKENDIEEQPQKYDVQFSEKALVLFKTIKKMEDVNHLPSSENEKIENIKIPYPTIEHSDSSSLVNYLKELSKIPKTHPEFASLEQFVLTIGANSEIEQLFNTIVEDVSKIHFSDTLFSVKELLDDARKSSFDYLKNPDSETTNKLMENIQKCMSSDFSSSIFRLRLSEKESLYEKLFYIGKKGVVDVGKGGFKTFFDTEKFSDVIGDFGNDIRDSFDDVISNIPHDIGVDVWDVDYDFSSHFPLITTAITLFKAGKQTIVNDADVKKTLKNAGVKIVSAAGGVSIGSLIGSLIFPGVGTAIGAAIGGFLGRKFASNINTLNLKELQEKIENQIEIIKEQE